MIGAGCALAVATLVCTFASAAPADVAPTTPAVPAMTVAPGSPAAPAPTAPAAARPRAGQLMFVFEAGGATYMKLADLETPEDDLGDLPIPPHGKLRAAKDGPVDSAIARVADRNVPAALRAWKGKAVKVENHCVARVVGFALVSRLIGEPSYAELEAWTTEGVMKAGHAVLAAKLDRCTGTFARDAALPDVIVPIEIHDDALAQAARAALLASEPAHKTQAEWDDQRGEAAGPARPWASEATFTTAVLRHPTTGAVFVSIHGYVSHGCGDPMANLWGLFRVDDGRLVPVQLRELGELESIDALLDLDGDGELEVLGKPWLGNETLLTRAGGEPLDSLRAPFIGCPC